MKWRHPPTTNVMKFRIIRPVLKFCVSWTYFEPLILEFLNRYKKIARDNFNLKFRVNYLAMYTFMVRLTAEGLLRKNWGGVLMFSKKASAVRSVMAVFLKISCIRFRLPICLMVPLHQKRQTTYLPFCATNIGSGFETPSPSLVRPTFWAIIELFRSWKRTC